MDSDLFEEWKKKHNMERGIDVKQDDNDTMSSKYSFSASKIGATTSPQVANQIGELNSRLNQGLKDVELGTMNQRLLDQVPQEHFTEIKRMAKLTGAEPSLHAPIQDLDLAGFGQQGWDPHERENKVRQLGKVVDKAYLLDPTGNTPITIHAGSGPVQKWQNKGLKEETREGIKEMKDARSEMGIVNQQSGEVTNIRYDKRKYFGKDEPIPWSVERRLDNMNQTSWDKEKFQLLQWKKDLDENNQLASRKILEINQKADISNEEKQNQLQIAQEEMNSFSSETHTLIRSAVEDMYERFEKYSPKEGEDAVDADIYKKNIYPRYKKKFEEKQEEIDEKLKEVIKFRNQANQSDENFKTFIEKQGELDELRNNQTEILRTAAKQMPAPNTWQPIDDFTRKETSQSIAEAAVDAFGKYGKNSPMLLLENVYPEFALSRADSLKATIKDSKKKFVELAMEKKEDGGLELSESEAKKHADKVIGVTWDVGHIYMLKKSGYTDKQIAEEAEKIAPDVKHLHLTDNFGYEDSHLPPGLGEVNIKEQLKAMEKVRAEEGTLEDFKKVRGIVEAGEFVANYKEVPHLYALSHLDSPVYTDDAGPHWEKAWDQMGNYAGGYGEMMPQKYFDLYGAPGFSQLPAALGGAGGTGGDRGRFASAFGQGDDEEV
jgi:hypothetical protein